LVSQPLFCFARRSFFPKPNLFNWLTDLCCQLVGKVSSRIRGRIAVKDCQTSKSVSSQTMGETHRASVLFSNIGRRRDRFIQYWFQFIEPRNAIVSPPIHLASRVTLTLSAICTLSILAWTLHQCNFGLDFADEGYYLVSIFAPFRYPVSLSQFGFIYHPLYKLVDGNIALLRQTNVLLTFCLAWTLAGISLKAIFVGRNWTKFSLIVISAAIASASLVFLRLWLPTPSYNWLSFQSLLITAIGLLLAEKHFSGLSVVGWLLVATGGWLAFMAKPTTAAALGLSSAVYLLLSG
jgi:hypothetical protein